MQINKNKNDFIKNLNNDYSPRRVCSSIRVLVTIQRNIAGYGQTKNTLKFNLMKNETNFFLTIK